MGCTLRRKELQRQAHGSRKVWAGVGHFYSTLASRPKQSALPTLPSSVKSAPVKEHREKMMEHPLETQYGLSARELLDAVGKRFRLKVALEGAVAEVQMEKKIQSLVGTIVERYEAHDLDGHPDFSIWLPNAKKPLLAECKNVRDHEEAYREGGKVVAYKAETQKTRASKGDPTSRFYGVDQFDILGVCLGKKTGDWSDFLFARVVDLARRNAQGQAGRFSACAVARFRESAPWYNDLGELLRQCTLTRSTRRS